MLKQRRILCLLALVMLCISTVSALFGQTRLGLHVTKEELQIWRQRAASGPYKSRSDVSANSPDDWNRIVTNANAFKAAPSSFRWAGPTLRESSGAIKKGGGEDVRLQNEPNGKALAHHIRDAAFVALVDDKRADRQALKKAVKGELLHATTISSLDFNNRSFWPATYYRDINPLFQTINWFNNYLYAYDYIDIADKLQGENTFSSQERNRIDAWLLAAAEFAQQEQDWDVNRLFTNRSSLSADAAYTPLQKQSAAQRGGATLLTHYASSGPGHAIYGLMQTFNNRRMACHRYAALVGIKLGKASLVESAKRYVKDWIKYSVFPDGTMGEMERWSGSIPDLGWGYCTDVIASAVTMADALARRGDHSLYEYNTSIGLYGTEGSKEETKNLHKTLKVMYRIAAKQVKWYGTNQKGNLTSAYLIDGETSSWKALHDVWLTMANLKYQDKDIRAMYMRQGAGMTPYWSSPVGQGKHTVWTGDWGTFPGLLFMFGQMEGKLNPYPNSDNVANNPIIDPINISINSKNNICNGERKGAASVTVSGGLAPYSYRWSDGSTTAALEGLVAGNYSVTVSDQAGSKKTATLTITQPAAIVITYQVSPASGQANDGAIEVSVSGGTGAYSYKWSTGATTKDLSGLVAGNYSVTVTDANGCQGMATVSLAAKAPLASIRSFTLLNGEHHQVIAGYNPIRDQDTINLALLPSGLLNVRANTSTDAIEWISFRLHRKGLNGEEFNEEQVIVEDHKAPFHLFNDQPWRPAVGSYHLAATPYSKEAQAGKGLSIVFYVIDQPLAEKGQAIEPLLSCVQENGNGTLTAHFGYLNSNKQAVNIQWGAANFLSLPEGQQAGVEYFEPGRHEQAFSVTFAAGSSLLWTLKGPDGEQRQVQASAHSPLCTLTQEQLRPRVVFSPNEDGIDDLWQIDNMEQYPGYEVVIFSRNGSQVFQAKPYQNNWDGKLLGKPLLSETYYYIIKDSKGPIKTGPVTILR